MFDLRMKQENKLTKLKWHNDTAKLSDLIPCEKNPRTLTEKQHKELKESLEKFDLVEVPAIDTNNKIVSGHQRVMILSQLYGGDCIIDIRKPNRKLTSEEYEEYLIRANKNTGSWDFDVLGNEWDIELLKKVGFSDEDFPEIDFDPIEKTEIKKEGPPEKFSLIVDLPNELEMRDLYDDLISKGYLVKEL
jgi:hypothetical protein